MLYKSEYISPLGKLFMASDGYALCGLWLDGQKYFPHSLLEDAVEKSDLDIFNRTKSWLDNYFSGEKTEISRLKLAPSGNKFRQDVWKILCEIPYGSVRTYEDIAKEIAELYGKDSMSAQAVGGAVGHNPISIIIPCHRVVGANGNLTGYAGGINTKIKLLELEGLDMTKFKA